MLNIVDVMDIPKIMDRFLGITWGVAMLILPFIFVFSLVTELHKAAEGTTPDYRSVIWTTALVVFATLVYRVWFMKIVAICEGLAMSILNYKDWIALMTIMSQKQQEVGIVGLFSIDMSGLILNITLLLAIVIEEIFNIIRFLFLSVLYLIGPIVLVSAIYGPIRMLFKGWLLSVVQVSFWIVVFRIFQAAVISFNVAQLIQDGNVAVTLIISAVLILACILAPAFTSKLFSGQNVGLLGSVVIGGMTYAIAGLKWIPSKHGKTSVAGATVGVASSVVSSVASSVAKVASKYVPLPRRHPKTETTKEETVSERQR